MKKLLEESTSVPVASDTRGLWRATLLTPGRGSSGNWQEDVIRRDGPKALKKGAKCFVTHNRLENGEPDPFSMWATLDSDSWYEEGVGLVADILVFDSWVDRVEEVAPHTALSVFLMGESDEHENITAILEDPQNGVDMVCYPGRPGSALVNKLYESAIRDSKKESTATPVEESKETKGLTQMDQEVKDAFEALEAKIDALVSDKQEKAAAEIDAEAFADAVDKAVAEKLEAIKVSVAAVEAAKADLLPTQVKTLNESAYRGEDVTKDIEDAKALAAEAKTIHTEGAVNETGRLGENATTGYVLRGFGEKAE